MLWTLGREVTLSCHTCYDTGPRFTRSRPKTPPPRFVAPYDNQVTCTDGLLMGPVFSEVSAVCSGVSMAKCRCKRGNITHRGWTTATTFEEKFIITNRKTAAVAHCVRAFASQAEVWVFEFQSRQT